MLLVILNVEDRVGLWPTLQNRVSGSFSLVQDRQAWDENIGAGCFANGGCEGVTILDFRLYIGLGIMGGMEEKSGQPVSGLSSEEKKELKVTLLRSPEGRLLLVGVAMALGYTFWLGIMVLTSPEESQVLVGMTATQIMFGRAASMAFGYSLGMGNSTIIPVCIAIETILVLIFYPLFVLSLRHLLVVNWLNNIFERIRTAAEARKGIVKKYGIVGLFVFVWFPFWMTGPMVGCVIGFLLGLRVRLTITAVLGGTYVAIFGWAFFLRKFHDLVASYSSYAAMVLMTVLVIIIVIVGHLLHRTGQEK